MKIVNALLIAGLIGSTACSTQNAGSSSAALKQAVESRLTTDPQLAQVEVSADANLNQVTLSGQVPSEEARSEAIDRAQAGGSSFKVVDKIDVLPAGTDEATSRSQYSEDLAKATRQKAKELGDKVGKSLDDAWLYTKVEAKLVGNSAAPALKINVDVENDVVTLRGVVQSETAKQDAERVARNTEGVKGVRNLLEVRS